MSFAHRTNRTESGTVTTLRATYDAAVAAVKAIDRVVDPSGYATAKAAETAAFNALTAQITTERRAAKAAYHADPANH